jgi:hypothetical protein
MTHVYVVVILRPDNAWRVAAGPGGIYAFAIKPMADGFADRLREHGIEAVVLPRTASQVADLLARYDLDPEAPDLVEAQATGVLDAVGWTIELADWLPGRVRGGDA